MSPYSILWVLILLGCSNGNQCNKYVNEEITIKDIKKIDSLFSETEVLRKSYNKTDFRNLKHDAYRIFSRTAISRKTRILEYYKKGDEYRMVYEVYLSKGSTLADSLLEKTEIVISEFDWNHIETLIYNYKFWATTPEIINLVLDGQVIIIEGTRSGADNCNKATSRIVIRGSPKHDDKIGWLFDDIHYFSSRLIEISEME